MKYPTLETCELLKVQITEVLSSKLNFKSLIIGLCLIGMLLSILNYCHAFFEIQAIEDQIQIDLESSLAYF